MTSEAMADPPQACIQCGKPLTAEEVHYYSGECEECVWDEHERIEAWRHGGDDPELDALYGVPAPVRH